MTVKPNEQGHVGQITFYDGESEMHIWFIRPTRETEIFGLLGNEQPTGMRTF